MNKLIKKSSSCILFLFLLCRVWSQSDFKPGYSASLIPDSLKLNANAVVRLDSSVFIYLSAENTRHFIHKVITVLNKNGDEQAEFLQTYDKLRKINYIKASLFDASGNLIRKLKPSEIGDFSGSAGYDLFDDMRYKTFKPLVSNYPYTVEFEYQMEYSGSLIFPKWYAFDAYNVSIENTILTMITPAGYSFHFKAFNYPEQPVVINKDKNELHIWKARNLKALENEPYSDDIKKYVPAVFTAPSGFSYGGYSGSMDTWDDFARWVHQLGAGRDALPEDRIVAIKELVKDIPDEREKVKKLYRYLQSRTRYFEIQLGIGGYQPIDAETVDEVGYGDCKGLSNYMKALLNAVGIESYYTLAAAGGNFTQILTDFPSLQFNHALLCVPLHGDTVWLECTSQIDPFGFLGDHTSDRKVLLIKQNGGQLVHTPVYSQRDNYQWTTAQAVILPEGNATVNAFRRTGGLQFDNIEGVLYYGMEEQKEWLYNAIDIPDFTISGYSFKQENQDHASSLLTLALHLKSYASVSGKRLFVPLNLLNRSTASPAKVKKRRTNFVRLVPYVDIDTVQFSIPESMEIEFVPENMEITSPFGSYISKVTTKANQITYFREVKINKGLYSKEQYEDFIRFYKDIGNADKSQAILIKKEP